MSTYAPFGATTYNLNSSISSTQTTIVLSSFLEPVTGTPYTMALINSDIAFGTVSPKTTSSEFISFTGITQNADGTATLTGVTRGLAKKYPFTTDSAYKLPHSGQTQFIISDAPQVFNEYVSLHNAETIDGIKTFTAGPIFNSSTGRPALSSDVDTAVATELVDFGQLSRQAIAGAANASTTVKGLVELATQAELDARTTVGGTGALLVPTPNIIRTVLTHDYAADSGSTDDYAITLTPAVTAYTVGDVYRFKANTANTGAATLAVNGLTAKPITKDANNVASSALATNDIRAGQLVTVIYDGTSMRMQSSTANSVNYDGTGAVLPAASAANLTSLPAANLLIASQATGDTLYASSATVWSRRAIGAANTVWKVAGGVPTWASPLTSLPVVSSYDLSTASGTQNIAHGQGVAPTYVRITIYGLAGIALNGTTAVVNIIHSIGVYNGSTTASVHVNTNSGYTGGIVNNSTNMIEAWTDASGGGNKAVATIALDATNVILTWTKTGIPTGTIAILVETFL